MRTYELVRLPLAASAAALLSLAACGDGGDGIVVRVPDAAVRDSGTVLRDAAADADKEDDAAVLADADVPDTSVEVDAGVDADLPDATVEIDAETPDATVEIDAALPDAAVRIDRDRDRWFEDEDCDDNNPSVFPGAAELCDGLDNDCDDDVDEGVVALPWYVDGDGDGWGTTSRIPVFSCSAVDGRTLVVGDCNDDDDAINPVATEVCNAADDDCDGFIDEGLSCEGGDISDVVTIRIVDTNDGIVRAWAPADVTAKVSSTAESGDVECRSGKVGSDGRISGTFTPCSGGTFTPYNNVRASGDGLYRLEVRLVRDGGEVVGTIASDYYLHASLSGARDCTGVGPGSHSNEEWFAAAAEYLETTHEGRTATFSTSAGTTAAGFAQIGNPFVHVNFTPRNNGIFAFGDYLGGQLGGWDWTNTQGNFEVLSLRKHFFFNEDQTFVLVKRHYEGRIEDELRENIIRWDGEANRIENACRISDIKYSGYSTRYQWCDVIVMNREGAGLCLFDSEGTIKIQHGPYSWANDVLSAIGLADNVDNAMWRKLSSVYSPQLPFSSNDDRRTALEDSSAQMSIEADGCDDSDWWCQYTAYRRVGGRGTTGFSNRVGWKHFSPKCYGDESCAGEFDALQYSFERRGSTLFLPDAEHYRF